MSETANKAVFLSYASQDAEAAKRICDALRAAGVEVWFDQNELVGGDAWDQKIRKQIKECALLIPIISEATQARTEGYFRLEWRLADQRTHLMAKGRAFLLPVVIDDTRDTDAQVPDSFTEVQWTRLPGGDTSAAFCARVKKLLGKEVGSVSDRPFGNPTPSEAGQRPALPGKSRPWLIPAILVALVAAFGAWFALRPVSHPASGLPPAVSGVPVTAQPSTARELVAKAWEQMNKAELARAELEIAAGFCRRATEVDENDADAWAAWSQVDSWMVFHNFDASPARREAARIKAERAMKLASASYEARLAQACFLVRGQAGGDVTLNIHAGEAEKLLRTLLRDKPDEPRARLALGILLRNTGAFPESRENFRHLAGNPAFATLAWNELGWAEFFAGDLSAAEAAIDRSIALQSYWGNLSLKGILALWWWGDLDQAKAVLDRKPLATRQEDNGIYQVVELHFYRREPEAMLQVLNSAPRDWLQSNGYDGPKAYFAGLAHQMAGRAAAAQVQWQTALKLVERRLSETPDSGLLLDWKGRLLAASGRPDEAEPILRLAAEMGAGGPTFMGTRTSDHVLLGRWDQAITQLEQWADASAPRFTAAMLRLNPRYDPLRDHPRFQALLARMEADPRFSPKARPPSAPSPISQLPSPSSPPQVDAKSVAVLAFANLSDDGGNEYFSDGISEELLNVLAKVPGLKVTARTSAFFFKGKQVPIADIAQQLGVAYVIEGSVRKQGDRVRITAQLIKAADGFPVWSDTFTRDLKDIFAVQDEIAGLIAQQLQLKLGASKVARVVNPEAYRLVLEGRYFWLQRTEEALHRAEASYVKALEYDPQFAQAHAGLADVWSIRAWYKLIGGNRQADDDLARAHTEVRLAIEIDPSLAETHATLGAVLFNQRKFSEANQAFQTSQRLNPNYGFAHFWHAQLLFAEGRSPEGLLALDRAIRADPLAFITLASHAIFLSQLGLNEKALVMNDRAIALHPDMFVPTIGQRADILLHLGRKEEALALARSVAQQASVQPRWWLDGIVIHVLRATGQQQEAEAHAARLLQTLPPDNMVRGYVLAGVGRPAEAVDQLLATGLESSLIFSFIFDTFWDEVRQDPRLPELLVKLNLVEEYRRGREALAQLEQERERKQ